MPSNDNPEGQRMPSRNPASSSASPRGILTPLAPILPSLRSPNNRRPPVMSVSNHSGASDRVRAPGRLSGRHRNVAELQTSELNPTLESSRPGPGFTLPPETGFSSRFGSDERPSSLRSLLDDTRDSSLGAAGLFSSRTSQRHDPPEETRRAKRRKLDADRLSSNFRGFQYGKYGQVQPGPLKLELVSCDGGLYTNEADATRYAAENILKNDTTVYCTEGPRCNIVLRHQGATVFTLKELVIKAPKSNFTSPVQAGMVFVSMTSDRLLTRTAEYQIEYVPAERSYPPAERDTPPNNEDPPQGLIQQLASWDGDGSGMTLAQMRARRLYQLGLEDEDDEDDEDDDLGVAQIPSEFNVSPPPFQVTTECSDDEVDGLNMRLDGQAPNRVGSLLSDSDFSDDVGQNNIPLSGTDERRRRGRRGGLSTALAEAGEAAQMAVQGAVRAVGGQLMTPSARFYIEPHKKSKYTIRFDPPIAARFILLKMWNPRCTAQANIDIQAVIAKGFAGPRFFPSIELR